MDHTTTPGRALAIAAGGVFLAGTLGILFEDVLLKGAPLALKHGLTLAILAGTIMVGHLANSARSARQWASAVSFSMVFVIGTVLVVLSSVGRQTADTIQTTAQIEADAGRRVAITQVRNRAVTMLEQAQASLPAACRGGNGKDCKGVKATIEVYEASIRGHDADLSKLGPVKVSNADAEQLAEILSTLFGMDKAKVKAGAVLLTPFAIALFLEFGVIVSFGFAFRHRPTIARLPGTLTRLPTISGPANDQHPVIEALERVGGSVASNRQLAGLMGVTDGESSKRVAEVADKLAIVRDGKQTRIALKAA